jgi:CDP-diacylglycerol--serine O-phosphatidyltransferase
MRKKYRKIYLLPSFFSMGNIFFGFLSLIFTFHEKYSWAALWIIVSAILDALDGIIARSTRTHSDFGTELDSLADAFSFGAAPSILLYFWGLRVAGTVGVFFSFIFLSAGILRLARYNVLQKAQLDRKFYTGLTIPSASMLIAAIVFSHPLLLETKLSAFLMAMVTLFVSFCMISTIKYRNLLSFNFRKRIDIKTALIVAILISSLIFYTKFFLLFFFTLNVLSGPVSFIFNLLKKETQKKLMRKQTLSEKTGRVKKKHSWFLG